MMLRCAIREQTGKTRQTLATIAGLLIGLGTGPLAVSASASDERPDGTRGRTTPASELVVTRPPEHFHLDPIYTKYISAAGYPIVGSQDVDDFAMKEAAWLVNLMLAERPDVRQTLIDGGSRMVVMDYQQMTTDVPEHAHLRPREYWDRRARGLGGSRTDPICSCGEENLLAYPGDPYPTENILIHEFAHSIHLRGLVNVDPTFDDRLRQAYDDAMQAGLWKDAYAASNRNEYWAEGVQSWFDNNRPPDSSHNHVNTRRELRAYDPALAGLCEEVFGNTKLVYSKPGTRLTGHLQGFDPGTAPTFRWPQPPAAKTPAR